MDIPTNLAPKRRYYVEFPKNHAIITRTRFIVDQYNHEPEHCCSAEFCDWLYNQVREDLDENGEEKWWCFYINYTPKHSLMFDNSDHLIGVKFVFTTIKIPLLMKLTWGGIIG